MRLQALLLALSVATALAGCSDAQSPQPAPARNASSESAPLFRHANIDLAWRAAQKSRRPVLVYVTSSNCRFCTKMLNETLSHPQIAQAANQWFETTKVSRDTQPDLVQQLGVRAFPTTLVVHPNGSLMDRVEGFVEPAKFAARVFVRPGQTQSRASAPDGVTPRNVAQR